MSEPVLQPSGSLRPQKSIIRTLLTSLPMALLLALITFGNASETETAILTLSQGLTFGFLLTLFILMIHTGKTSRYRSILFVVGAFCFILTFITNLLEVRGSMVLTAANIFSGDTPFCHIVIPMIIIPAAITKTIIFPGHILEGFASIGSMLIIWLGASLALGRGWCSWVCFYGGLDEGFSKLCRKPKIKSIDKRWTYLPWGVLLAIVLLSSVLLSPFYCEWLCPFKTVTEFNEIIDVKTLLQFIIFVSLFLALVIILPILTGKRTQCGLFCPFGAFQSWTNKLNIFEIRVNRDKCIDCGLCIRKCPTFSIDEESLKKGKTLITCTKCGQCVDLCPTSAITYHIKGTPIGLKPETARVFFLYPSYLFASAILGGMIAGALWRILRLVTTGTII